MFESGVIKNSIDNAAFLHCVEETLSKSRYKNFVKSCCIQYSIENKSPICCIELQHPVPSDSSMPSSDEVRTFLQSNITELNQIGLCIEYTVGFEWSENPELCSLVDSDHLWNEMSDRLVDMDRNGMRSILNELSSQLMESNDCFVMFGPRYSPEKSQWSSDVTLWVCVASPWARRFLPKIYYTRPQSVQSVKVQYWSLTISQQVKLSTSKPIGDLWLAREGNFFTDFLYPTSIFPGQRLCIPPPALLKEDALTDVDTPFFTLGPSLCSFSKDRESCSRSNHKFYITAAHSFLLNNSTTTIAKRRSEFYENGKSFEYCSSLGAVGSLVDVPTDSAGNITHDLALVSISSRVRSSTDLLVGHKILQSSDHTDSNKLTLSVSGYLSSLMVKEATSIGATVYKNGGTSGLSTGAIVTIGQEWIAHRDDETNADRIGTHKEEDHLGREYVIVKASKGTFSEYGDSGSPVWLAPSSNDDAETATVAGILTGSLNGMNNLSVVALLDDAVISRFFDAAGNYS